jgi:dihydroorotase
MTISIPQIDDFHVHLRQGSLMDLVTPTVPKGGCRLALVMPNLKPPIKTVREALEYKTKLTQLSPSTEFLMTLYLHSELTPDDVYAAKQAGIVGIKSYPKGVTTNSDSGIESYSIYYPIFEAMEAVGLILNLHGEIPSDDVSDVCVLNAERLFLGHLEEIAKDFPKLKIVLEHVILLLTSRLHLKKL